MKRLLSVTEVRQTGWRSQLGFFFSLYSRQIKGRDRKGQVSGNRKKWCKETGHVSSQPTALAAKSRVLTWWHHGVFPQVANETCTSDRYVSSSALRRGSRKSILCVLFSWQRSVHAVRLAACLRLVVSLFSSSCFSITLCPRLRVSRFSRQASHSPLVFLPRSMALQSDGSVRALWHLWQLPPTRDLQGPEWIQGRLLLQPRIHRRRDHVLQRWAAARRVGGGQVWLQWRGRQRLLKSTAGIVQFFKLSFFFVLIFSNYCKCVFCTHDKNFKVLVGSKFKISSWKLDWICITLAVKLYKYVCMFLVWDLPEWLSKP